MINGATDAPLSVTASML